MTDLLSPVLEKEHVWSTVDIGTNSISSVIYLDQISVSLPSQAIPKIKPQSHEPYLNILNKVKYSLDKREQIDYFKEDRELGDLKDILQEISNEKPESVEGDSISEELSAELLVMFADKEFDLKNPTCFDNVVNALGVLSAKSADSDISKPSAGSATKYAASFITTGSNMSGRDFVPKEALNSSDYRALMKMYTILLKSTTAKVYNKILTDKQNIFKISLTKSQKLEAEIDELLKIVKNLQESLNVIKEYNVIEGVRVLDLKQKRGQLMVLYKTTEYLHRLFELERLYNELLAVNDYVGVMDVFDEAFLIYNKELDQTEFSKSFALDKVLDKVKASTSIRLLKSTDNLADIDVEKTRSKEIAPGVMLISDARNSKHISLKGIDCVTLQCNRFLTSSKSIAKQISTDFNNIIKDEFTQIIAQIKTIPPNTARLPDETILQSAIRKIVTGDHIILGRIQQNSTVLATNEIVLTPKQKELKSLLKPLIFGLIRMDKFNEALEIYKELCYKETESLLVYAFEKGGIDILKGKQKTKFSNEEFGLELKMLSLDSFFRILSEVFVNFLQVIGQCGIYQQIFADVIMECEERGMKVGTFDYELLEAWTSADNAVINSPKIKPKGESEVFPVQKVKKLEECSMEAKNCYYQIIDYTHLLASKILSSRSTQNNKLNPTDFFKVFTTTYEFQSTGERMIGRLFFNIKSVLLAQGKSWLTYFHEEKLKQIGGLLDNEQWIQADIPIDFQKLIERLKYDWQVGESMKSIKDEVGVDVEVEDLEHGDGDISAQRMDFERKNDDNATEKYLVVEGVKYHTVVSVLLFIKMMSEYVDIAKHVSLLTPEITNRIYELVKMFNSRTCQLILGSGAINSAGLESITAKQLVLTSQSLQLVSSIFNYISKTLNCLLPVRQQTASTQYDKILQDYKNHQEQIHLRIIELMGERIRLHAQTMKPLDWDAPKERDVEPETNIMMPMFLIVKEISNLHQLLRKYFVTEISKFIVSTVVKESLKILEDIYKTINLYSSGAKQRLLRDVHYFNKTISGLEDVDGPGTYLEVVANNLKIKDFNAGEAVRQSTVTDNPTKKNAFSINFGKMGFKGL